MDTCHCGVIRILEGYRGEKTTSLSPHQYTYFRAGLLFSADPDFVPWKSAFMMEVTLQVKDRGTGSTSFSTSLSDTIFHRLFTAVFYELEGREREVLTYCNILKKE